MGGKVDTGSSYVLEESLTNDNKDDTICGEEMEDGCWKSSQ